MSKLIAVTRYPDSREVEYVTDDFCRIVHCERTGAWTLLRIPTPQDILDNADTRPFGTAANARNIPALTAPIRVTPPVLADAPRHNADAWDGDDD